MFKDRRVESTGRADWMPAEPQSWGGDAAPLHNQEKGREEVKKEKPVICHVYVFDNGMVATIDQHGQQMPKYQGRKEDVWSLILADKTPDTEIHQ